MLFLIIFLYSLKLSCCFNRLQKNYYNWENNLNNTKFLDLTERCINSSKINIFIPNGVGAADSVVILIARSPRILKCNIHFHISRQTDSQIQIIVLEFLDNLVNFTALREHCSMSANQVISPFFLNEIEPKGILINICSRLRETKFELPLFVHSGSFSEMSLGIDLRERNFLSLKITATSGRLLDRHKNCNHTYELYCRIERKGICINRALSCDRNLNCGEMNHFDEDYKLCRVSRTAYLWMVAIAGLVTLMIVMGILIYLLKNNIAKITDNFFIFNEDEDNKLVIKSQLNSHVWVKPKTNIDREPPCFCQTASETNDSPTSD